MTTYFISCRNLDELKKAYKAAAMKNHPDKGGDTATMQAINAEYSARFEVLKRSQNEQAAEDTTGKTHATTESAGDFINIISALLKLYGLHASAAAGRAARDGMGSTVYVYVRTPASVHEAGSDEAAFAAAIKSGVMLSVPQADGTRKGIPVKVLSVSPVYTDRVPADWASQLSAQIDREFGTK